MDFISILATENNIITEWKEVPAFDLKSPNTITELYKFNPQKRIKETNYAFSGTVIGRKDYEISWTKDNGEKKQYIYRNGIRC